MVPIVLLYASGYRYKSGYGVVQTGGIFLSVPYNDAVVSLNGREIGRAGLLNKSFYIDDLAPSAYVVHVAREGSHSWYRTLIVEPQIVTDGRVVLVPEEIEIVKLTRGGATASTTRRLSPVEYDRYEAAFEVAATSTRKSGGDKNSREVATVEHGNIVVRWLSKEEKPPGNFCGRPSYCSKEIFIERGKQTAVSVAFFDGGIVYATREGGVFFSEIDVRSTPVSVPLYQRAHADVRVVDEKLILKDGSILYEVSL